VIGIILVTHGTLGEALYDTLTHIMGPQPHIAVLSVDSENSMACYPNKILSLIETVDQGKGVILLTDMFGGTPSNLAISALSCERPLEVIAGVNLPLFIKLVEIRGNVSLDDAVLVAQEAGRKYIHSASSLLKN